MNSRRGSSNRPAIPPGVALMPEDFVERLTLLKEVTGLSWEGLAVSLGVDSRQLHRWRKGGSPNGGAMLSLVRLASLIPGGLDMLLDADPITRRRTRR